MYQDIFEKIAFHYDELVREGHDPFQDPPEVQEYMDEWDGEEFLNLLALTGKEKVLEIGCGTGRLAGRVLNLCMEYTGIDLSGASVMRARANLAAVPGTPFRNFLCGQFPDCILPGQHWIPPGSCPVSLVLRQYPQRRNTTTTLGVFSWLLIPELASSVHP